MPTAAAILRVAHRRDPHRAGRTEKQRRSAGPTPRAIHLSAEQYLPVWHPGVPAVRTRTPRITAAQPQESTQWTGCPRRQQSSACKAEGLAIPRRVGCTEKHRSLNFLGTGQVFSPALSFSREAGDVQGGQPDPHYRQASSTSHAAHLHKRRSTAPARRAAHYLIELIRGATSAARINFQQQRAESPTSGHQALPTLRCPEAALRSPPKEAPIGSSKSAGSKQHARSSKQRSPRRKSARGRKKTI
jgi:hypothetical protein